MAVFQQLQPDLRDSELNTCICMSWSAVQPILAIGRKATQSDQGDVVFAQPDRGQVKGDFDYAFASFPLILSFHPLENLLLSAWNDGSLRLMNVDSGELSEITKMSFPLTAVFWSDDGTVVAAVDEVNPGVGTLLLSIILPATPLSRLGLHSRNSNPQIRCRSERTGHNHRYAAESNRRELGVSGRNRDSVPTKAIRVINRDGMLHCR